MTDETYSVSRLRSYADCPRKYWWQYRQGVRKEPFAAAAMDIGTMFHACMDAALHMWHATGDVQAAIETARLEPRLWYVDPRLTPNGYIGIGDGWATEPVLDRERQAAAWSKVERMVASYMPDILLRRGLLGVASLPDGSPAVEAKLDITLGGHRFTGFVDAVLINADGERVAVDWKCRSKFYAPEAILLDSQLYFYMHALRAQFNLDVAYALQVELSTAAPRVQTHRLDAAHADRMTAELLTVADRLAADSTFAGRNDAYHCKSCDFLRECTSLLTG